MIGKNFSKIQSQLVQERREWFLHESKRHIPSDKNVWFIIWFISMLGCSVTSTKLPIIFTGTPTATECGGRSVMTRPPAPTWHPSPILMFPKTLAPAPSNTPLPTFLYLFNRKDKWVTNWLKRNPESALKYGLKCYQRNHFRIKAS